jgi:hypothetical protein
MHVRKMRSAEALLTRAPVVHTEGSAKIALVTTPQNESCGNQKVSFAQDGDWFTITKKGPKELTLRLFDKCSACNDTCIPGQQKCLARDHSEKLQPKLKVDLKPGENNGEFYWYGDSGGITYFVMLTDVSQGRMIRSDTPDIPNIERYYYIEAYTANSACASFRPDKGSQFHRWPEPASGDRTTCDVVGGPTQNGTGAGGHDYP